MNRLTSVETRNISGVVLASYHYTLNAKGQRVHVEEGADGQIHRSIDYEYDAADRLIEERSTDPVLGNRTISYTYDPVGNRLNRADNGVVTEYRYDENDRLLTESGFSYTHDDNGNLLTKSGNGENWQLEYNALNQLTRANISTPQGASVSEYAYDHDGIRVGKTINGSEQISYLVDKHRPYAQVLEEIYSQGTLNRVTNYVYGDDLLSRNVNGAPEYYLYDGMGSARGLSDAAGSVSATYRYDAYGQLSAQSGDSGNAYLYRGEQYDPELDAYYLRARYYQPGMGRFLTVDPFQGVPTTPISLHRYLYGNANPTNYIDPSGKTSLTELMVVGGTMTILQGMNMTTYYSETLQRAYATLGEKFFPDAYIFGLSANIPQIILGAISSVLPEVPLKDFIGIAGGATGGWEIVMSLSSAEIALFAVGGGYVSGGNIGLPGQLKDMPPSVYKGQVFNLWNTDNYKGPFLSGGAMDINLFCSPSDGLNGPWGFSVSKSLKIGVVGKNLTLARTHYWRAWNSGNLFSTEYSVGVSVMTVSALIEALWHINSLDVASSLVSGLASATFWQTTAIAKEWWNRNSNHSISTRQMISREQYNTQYDPDFQSGPGLLIFGQLY